MRTSRVIPSLLALFLTLASLFMAVNASRADGWTEPGPWQVRHDAPGIDDLAAFLGVDHWSGGFVLPEGLDSVRIAVEFYRDGKRLDEPHFETSWLRVERGPRDGAWAVQFAPGKAVARVGDPAVNVLEIHLRCQSGASTGGTFPAEAFGARGGASWIGGLHENDPTRPLLLYKWKAASGHDLNGPTPRTIDQLLERTTNGDLMLVWLEGG